MLRRTFTAAVLVIGVLFLVVSGLAGDTSFAFQERRCPEPPKSPFRYVITYENEADYHSPDGGKRAYRVVEVLLDPDAFSEATLRRLFELLSKRFPKSDKLFVHVHTSLEDVYTPEEADQMLPLAMCDTLPGDKHAWAMYNRSNEYEGFDYSHNARGGAVKTVKLRGNVIK